MPLLQYLFCMEFASSRPGNLCGYQAHYLFHTLLESYVCTYSLITKCVMSTLVLISNECLMKVLAVSYGVLHCGLVPIN